MHSHPQQPMGYGAPVAYPGQPQGMSPVMYASGPPYDQSGGSIGEKEAPIPETSQKLDFYIPKEKAGGVIGKGASVLKGLQKEFGIFIRLDRSEIRGMRKVIMRGEDEAVLIRAREKIIEISQQSPNAANFVEDPNAIAANPIAMSMLT